MFQFMVIQKDIATLQKEIGDYQFIVDMSQFALIALLLFWGFCRVKKIERDKLNAQRN